MMTEMGTDFASPKTCYKKAVLIPGSTKIRGPSPTNVSVARSRTVRTSRRTGVIELLYAPYDVSQADESTTGNY